MPIASVVTLSLEKLKPQLQQPINRAKPSETFLNMKRTIIGHKSHQVTTVLDWFMCCFFLFFSCPSFASQQVPLSVSFQEFLCVFCEVAGLGNPPNEEVLQDSKQRMLEMLETHGAAKNLTVDKLLRDWTNSHCHKASFC